MYIYGFSYETYIYRLADKYQILLTRNIICRQTYSQDFAIPFLENRKSFILDGWKIA